MYNQNFPPYIHYCRNLSQLRKQFSITQKELAKIMGVSIPCISLIDRGLIPKRLPRRAMLRSAELFGYELVDLMRETLPREPVFSQKNGKIVP